MRRRLAVSRPGKPPKAKAPETHAQSLKPRLDAQRTHAYDGVPAEPLIAQSAKLNGDAQPTRAEAAKQPPDQ